MKLTACPILAANLDPPMILKKIELHIVCSEVSVAIKLFYKIEQVEQKIKCKFEPDFEHMTHLGIILCQMTCPDRDGNGRFCR